MYELNRNGWEKSFLQITQHGFCFILPKVIIIDGFWRSRLSRHTYLCNLKCQAPLAAKEMRLKVSTNWSTLVSLDIRIFLTVSVFQFRPKNPKLNLTCMIFFYSLFEILEQCTEMRFGSFHSGGFITAIVFHRPERKLAKRNSVQLCSVVWHLFQKRPHIFLDDSLQNSIPWQLINLYNSLRI